MSEKRAPLEKFITPAGVAVWPRLTEPDYKYKKAEGEFSVKVRLSAADSQPLIDRIEELIAEKRSAVESELKELMNDPKKKAKAAVALRELEMAGKPYKSAVDDEGNETGEFEFNVKMAHKVTNQKTQKINLLFPLLFDAKRNKLPSSVQIWGGSIVKVAGQYKPFYTAALGVGVSLRLNAVQVIKLVSAGSARNASSFGFGEEEGFEAEGSEFNDEDSNESTSTEEGEEDF
jgi:hypothetical protein